jgi:hypothetical protein
MKKFSCAKVTPCNFEDTDSHFHVGSPHLRCKCRSASQFDKIDSYEMPVPREECRTLCSHQLVNLCLEFIMLPCGKAFTDIVHVAISIQPLLVCRTH